MTSPRAWDGVLHYLAAFAVYYPDIANWSIKVRAGIRSGDRSVFAFVTYRGDLVGLAITKNKEDAKLCHISVADCAREEGIGASLVQTALLEVLSAGARRIHVTTGEEVTSRYAEFFERVGFRPHSVWRNRYRLGFEELEWAASRETMSKVIRSLYRPRAEWDECPDLRSSLMRLSWDPQTEDLQWMRLERPLLR